MRQILFGLPNGDEIHNPTYEYVENLIMNKEISFWIGGSGQSALRYIDSNFESKLYIMADENYGFYLEYYFEKRKFIISNNNLYNETAKIYVGGEPIDVPKAFFLNKYETSKQIKEFFTSGKMDANLNWVDDSTIDWNYGVVSNDIGNKTFEELILERKRARKERLKKNKNM